MGKTSTYYRTSTDVLFYTCVYPSLYTVSTLFKQDVDITACTSGRGQLVIGGKFMNNPLVCNKFKIKIVFLNKFNN